MKKANMDGLNSSQKKAYYHNAGLLFQSKRTGDQAQAHACLRLGKELNRTDAIDYSKGIFKYDRTDYKSKFNGDTLDLETHRPIYFVTHDRIAMAYALSIGCNVIFLQFQRDSKCNFIIFRKISDPNNREDDETVMANLRNQSNLLEIKVIKKYKLSQGNVDQQISEIEKQNRDLKDRFETKLSVAENGISNSSKNGEVNIKHALKRILIEIIKYMLTKEYDNLKNYQPSTDAENSKEVLLTKINYYNSVLGFETKLNSIFVHEFEHYMKVIDAINLELRTRVSRRTANEFEIKWRQFQMVRGLFQYIFNSFITIKNDLKVSPDAMTNNNSTQAEAEAQSPSPSQFIIEKLRIIQDVVVDDENMIQKYRYSNEFSLLYDTYLREILEPTGTTGGASFTLSTSNYEIDEDMNQAKELNESLIQIFGLILQILACDEIHDNSGHTGDLSKFFEFYYDINEIGLLSNLNVKEFTNKVLDYLSQFIEKSIPDDVVSNLIQEMFIHVYEHLLRIVYLYKNMTILNTIDEKTKVAQEYQHSKESMYNDSIREVESSIEEKIESNPEMYEDVIMNNGIPIDLNSLKQLIHYRNKRRNKIQSKDINKQH